MSYTDFIANHVAQIAFNKHLVQLIRKQDKNLIYHTAYFSVPEGAVNRPTVLHENAHSALEAVIKEAMDGHNASN